MQLLASSSEEGSCETLGIVNGTVNHLASASGIRLPHMGWNSIYSDKNHPLLSGIDQGSYFYFIHNYALPVGKNTVAYCQHGQLFSAIIQQDNFMGVQFHPERSGKPGIQLLKNFLSMNV